jgi:hypothetical protein
MCTVVGGLYSSCAASIRRVRWLVVCHASASVDFGLTPNIFTPPPPPFFLFLSFSFTKVFGLQRVVGQDENHGEWRDLLSQRNLRVVLRERGQGIGGRV